MISVPLVHVVNLAVSHIVRRRIENYLAKASVFLLVNPRGLGSFVVCESHAAGIVPVYLEICVAAKWIVFAILTHIMPTTTTITRRFLFYCGLLVQFPERMSASD